MDQWNVEGFVTSPDKFVPWVEVRARLDIDEEKLAAQREYADRVVLAHDEEQESESPRPGGDGG